MSETYESWYRSTLTKKFSASDTTMYVATNPTKTKWRIFLKAGTQEEWVSFSWIATSPNRLTGCTRQLSKTSDPATSQGSWYNWIAWTPITLVAMHDQLLDKQANDEVVLAWYDFANAASRNAALWGNWAATKNYTNVYLTDPWVYCQYNTTVWERQNIEATSTAGAVLLEGNQTVNWVKTFTTNLISDWDLYANDQTLLWWGSETMGLLRMWSSYLYWIWINWASTVLHRHPLWSAIILWIWDWTTVTEHLRINSSTDMQLWWLSIYPTATDAEAITWTATNRTISPRQLIDSKNYSTTIGQVTATWSNNSATTASINLSSKGWLISVNTYIENTAWSNRNFVSRIETSNDWSSRSTLLTLFSLNQGTTNNNPAFQKSITLDIQKWKYIRGYVSTDGTSSSSTIEIYSQPLA